MRNSTLILVALVLLCGCNDPLMLVTQRLTANDAVIHSHSTPPSEDK